jgi:ATP-dependent RNA helicase DeaD
MTDSIFSEVPAGLGPVLEQRGFQSLTEIQHAVLDANVVGLDLRIMSQTGSGKTVALGLVVAESVAQVASEKRAASGPARPEVLLVAPTRELAVQLADELTWLFQPLGAKVGSLTGGTSMGNDFRLLKRNPVVLVGTPGRLIDHMNRGSLSLDHVSSVVLDEADEMLAMGFIEEVTAILDDTPDTRRTHLVSATLPRAVRSIAERYQRDAVLVTGKTPGKANGDITHQTMVVGEDDRLSALINLLLLDPSRKTLVFVRTRVDATGLAEALVENGFGARALSGDLNQRERTATLNAFRKGTTKIVVATDVAARGLDVQDIAQVVHVDLPSNAEVLTHRSGRTGRAGRKGTSVLFVPPRAYGKVNHMLRQARIDAIPTPVVTPKDVKRAADERIFEILTTTNEDSAGPKRRFRRLAEKLLAERDPVVLLGAMLEREDLVSFCAPREVRQLAPEKNAPKSYSSRPNRRSNRPGDWARFQVSWGSHHGADPRRLLAVVCRRGSISSGDVGSITISERSSMVEVTQRVAKSFARAARRPDARDPQIKFREWQESGSKRRRDAHEQLP